MIQQPLTLRSLTRVLASVAMIVFVAGAAWARTEIQDDGTTTTADAEQEAQKFFRQRPARRPAEEKKGVETQPSTDEVSTGGDDHYLALHLGGFLSSDAYQWSGADPHSIGPGRLNAGLTYRMGQLGKLADWAWRADVIGYEFSEGRALQIGLLPLLMFPDSGSRFPIYFGLGAGLGMFPTQLQGKSFLAIDYQLLGGVRFFNVLGNTGFFVESGLKNHFFLLSDGQFNGWFLTVGTLFTF